MSQIEGLSDPRAILAWLEKQHPLWHSWQSAGGDFWAVRRGKGRLSRNAVGAGAVMTIPGESDPAVLHDLLTRQEWIEKFVGGYGFAGLVP
jgi:hypothetical protein